LNQLKPAFRAYPGTSRSVARVGEATKTAYKPKGTHRSHYHQPVVGTPKEADALVYGVEGPEILIDAVRGKAA